MSIIFLTGSTQGLGRATAEHLIAQGHQVVLHARSTERLASIVDIRPKACDVVVGDLNEISGIYQIAEQVNKIGQMNAVIHNAGVYASEMSLNADGYSSTFMVNTLAPYLLTALIQQPERLIYLSSSMHYEGNVSLQDIEWKLRRWNSSAAYSDSKLFVTTLALAVARKWPHVLSHAVDPGWVPTRMGGANAPDDQTMGHLTQSWLAVAPASEIGNNGGYWHHLQRQLPHRAASDIQFQDSLMVKLAELTEMRLFQP
ncbi:SDR family NAD(P)-dependent oxidoreductase [uncultured Tolumonas sp.]|uniref:SDR family NAD(P)-dependent oxidoreductase n=1 Tax=uncultured Tolumonas sp. TaxID=263765 RepID=UPI002A0A440C|nr:SDR family NAD(P)-dependent oxidoreductase [uncultured Tolumonas sp.]